MSLTRALDAKISQEFAEAFGDEVVRELSSDGDAELSEALERALHSADVSAARRVVEVTYDALRKGKTWPKPSWREAFVLAQLRVCVESLRECEESGRRVKAAEAVRAADMTLIVGAPGEAVQPFIEAAESLLDVHFDTNAYEASVEGSGMLFPDSAPCVDWGERRWLRRLDEPISPKEFKREYYSTETPVVMTGVGSSWPAMKKWKDLAWWRRFHGHRFVPLELGRYSDEHNWHEEVKSMGDFISEDMVPAMSASGMRDQPVAYLAQHQLIEQISSLSADFTPPEYCRKSLERINVWMGTGGTITPCHFDTYDNFLGQVAGFKLVRLYLESDNPYMYRFAGSSGGASRHSQGNFSAVDVENPDLAQFPDFANATPYDVILAPGDFVYIPAKCWHYVRSLTPSISLNFWF